MQCIEKVHNIIITCVVIISFMMSFMKTFFADLMSYTSALINTGIQTEH